MSFDCDIFSSFIAILLVKITRVTQALKWDSFFEAAWKLNCAIINNLTQINQVCPSSWILIKRKKIKANFFI